MISLGSDEGGNHLWVGPLQGQLTAASAPTRAAKSRRIVLRVLATFCSKGNKEGGNHLRASLLQGWSTTVSAPIGAAGHGQGHLQGAAAHGQAVDAVPSASLQRAVLANRGDACPLVQRLPEGNSTSLRGWEIVYPCIPDPDEEDEGGQASSLAVSTRWISVAKLLQSDLATLAQREGGE
ncbi:hypothetical protein B296_00013096 [Ensete ventricosum]|uniref:Uncharacterized protein n=1 Tax=Ensete ventricosum TaxID=4639 RepID=A0A426ZBX7_ENSVE|nr:hypothetical protein B296_00013096 [Ensete ventricosum]